MAELLRIHPDNPEMRKIGNAVEILRKGGLAIYPTDTVYGIGCDLHNKKGIEKLINVLGLKANKLQLSFICNDLAQVAQYTKPIPTHIFKILKRCLPGPFTFLLEASHEVPKIVGISKKTVGIRIPNNNISRVLVSELGNPIISASIKDEDQIIEYTTDAEVIFERYQKRVDVVIDGGLSGITPSTVVNLGNNEIELVREGLGDVDLLYK